MSLQCIKRHIRVCISKARHPEAEVGGGEEVEAAENGLGGHLRGGGAYLEVMLTLFFFSFCLPTTSPLKVANPSNTIKSVSSFPFPKRKKIKKANFVYKPIFHPIRSSLLCHEVECLLQCTSPGASGGGEAGRTSHQQVNLQSFCVQVSVRL